MRKCSSLRKENSRENIERRKNLLQKPRLSIKSVWSIFSIGVSPSGKAGDSESPIRRFESYHSSHEISKFFPEREEFLNSVLSARMRIRVVASNASVREVPRIVLRE